MGTPPKKLRGEGMVGQRPVGGNRAVSAESVADLIYRQSRRRPPRRRPATVSRASRDGRNARARRYRGRLDRDWARTRLASRRRRLRSRRSTRRGRGRPGAYPAGRLHNRRRTWCFRLRREGRSGEGDGGRSAMTIVAIGAVKTAIGRSRRAAREARAGRCCRSENRDTRLATFRDCRGDARRRSASRVGFDATFAARDARDSRSGACGSVGRRGGGRRTSCRTRCHGTGVYGGMSEGDAVMWEKQSVDAQPTSSRSTFSRKLTNDWLSFVAASEFLKRAEIPSEVRVSKFSVRFVCDISQDRPERL
jgi:hypothetical protein